MRLVRRLTVASMSSNLVLRSVHIRGGDNTVADLLSRFSDSQARLAAPWLNSCPDTIPPLTTQVNLVATLVLSAMSPASQVSYFKTFQHFEQFCSNSMQSSALPAPPASVLLYVAHLYQSGYASSSIHRTVSIIAFYHKLYQVTDPTSSFLVKKVLAGVAKYIPSRDLRSPITPCLPRSLVNSCPFVAKSSYNSLLVSAMYLLAFHAFLRIGEILSNSTKYLFTTIRPSLHSNIITDRRSS
jgi:hypothetical protein